ncbi:E3 ubiquitin-protein ligase RNF14-like [Dreissena polymorpha]|nr:E3 ubiquitin-protein ligase RNF14-like [Dreissena polymorpha]
MAVGGIPECYSNLTEAELHENQQAQNEEIEVLKSIFDGEDEKLDILSQASPGDGSQIALTMLKLNVPVFSPNQIHVAVYQTIDQNGDSTVNSSGVQLSRSQSGQRMIWEFAVDYLPPICLHVTLPQSYPSQEPPIYAVACPWMSPQQLTLVCHELDKMWDTGSHDGSAPCMPVLYTWIDWLTENVLSMLGVVDSLSVSVHSVDEDIDDCRVVMETTDLNNIVTTMIRYNMSQRLRDFYRSNQECEICYHSGPGAQFVLLPDCGHHMCRNCLSSHCLTIVQEGNVHNLLCPMYKCKADLHPTILKELLSKEDFERYETLALQKALDVMDDVTYCPRCNCVVISEPEKHLMLGVCPQCNFTFCTECRQRWHQGEKCASITGDVKEIVTGNPSKEAKEQHRREMEKRKENRYSDLYVQKMSKKCPKCRSPMMKIGGCNFVKCGLCGQSLCFACGEAIVGYQHFVDNTACSTFSTDTMIDNADMPLGIHYLYNYQAPVMQANRPRERDMAESEGRRIKDRLANDPQLKAERCFACKQTNIKENRNNLIRCWSCKASFCCYCKCKIVGPVGRHFSGARACPQHSD